MIPALLENGYKCVTVSELLELDDIVIDKESEIFSYPKVFHSSFTLQVIRLEIGALAAWTPAQQAQIEPYAAKYYPHVFEQPTTSVLTVTPERTFWEKATILHQEANRPERLEISISLPEICSVVTIAFLQILQIMLCSYNFMG